MNVTDRQVASNVQDAPLTRPTAARSNVRTGAVAASTVTVGVALLAHAPVVVLGSGALGDAKRAVLDV